jgi:acetyltransferase-like isoleucine patch superfamily enzyme
MAVHYYDQQAVTIGHNVSLGDEVTLGANVMIGNNVTIYPGAVIGDNCHIFDGAVIGRPPKSAGNTTRPLDPSLRSVEIGANSIIGANAVLYTGITLGTRVLIGDLASIREGCTLADEVVVGRGVMVMYSTTIGARTRVIDGAILTGNMLIEEDVFIGPGVNSVNDNEVYLKRFGLQPFEAVGPIIRRFALIGTGANLSAGIEVGVGAIVAPSAMVTADVPAWTIVVGIPAKPYKMVDDDKRHQILAHFCLPLDYGLNPT